MFIQGSKKTILYSENSAFAFCYDKFLFVYRACQRRPWFVSQKMTFLLKESIIQFSTCQVLILGLKFRNHYWFLKIRSNLVVSTIDNSLIKLCLHQIFSTCTYVTHMMKKCLKEYEGKFYRRKLLKSNFHHQHNQQKILMKQLNYTLVFVCIQLFIFVNTASDENFLPMQFS